MPDKNPWAMLRAMLTTLQRFVLFTVIAFVLLSAGIGATDLAISVNGVPWNVLPQTILSVHAKSLDGGATREIPLSFLFPYLDNVELLEAGSGDNRVYWEAEGESLETWERARLVRRGTRWFLEVGDDRFSAPDRINVYGDVRELNELRVWSSFGDAVAQGALENHFSLRGILVRWTEVEHLEARLSTVPRGRYPHVLLLDDLERLAIPQMLGRGRVYAGSIPLSSGPVDASVYIGDFTHPDLALSILPSGPSTVSMADAAMKSDFESLFEDLAEKSRWLRSPPQNHEGTDTEVFRVVHLPWSERDEQNDEDIRPFPNPDSGQGAPLVRRRFLAEANDAGDADLRDRIYEDASWALGWFDQENPAFLDDPRILPFYRAYPRIASLVTTGAVSPQDAAEILTEALKSDG